MQGRRGREGGREGLWTHAYRWQIEPPSAGIPILYGCGYIIEAMGMLPILQLALRYPRGLLNNPEAKECETPNHIPR